MYLTIKALHLISMVAWFAGLFYIFRLFVYHLKYTERSGVPETMVEMERKLIKIIIRPAAVLTILMGGILLMLNPALLSAGWIWLKLFLVVLLIVYQIFATYTHSRLTRGDYFLTEKQCRMINEVPTLLLIGVVLLAVLKPF